MNYSVEFNSLKDASNLVFLDDNRNELTVEQFEEELQTGYRAGIVIVPVSNAIQIQVLIMTPYHKDVYEIDPGFLVSNYEDFCNDTGRETWIPEDQSEYLLGEVTY